MASLQAPRISARVSEDALGQSHQEAFCDMSPNTRVFAGERVLLPGHDQPQPATIVVDAATGKITDVRRQACTRQDFPDVRDSDFVDAKDGVIIPGVVE